MGYHQAGRPSLQKRFANFSSKLFELCHCNSVEVAQDAFTPNIESKPFKDASYGDFSKQNCPFDKANSVKNSQQDDKPSLSQSHYEKRDLAIQEPTGGLELERDKSSFVLSNNGKGHMDGSVESLQMSFQIEYCASDTWGAERQEDWTLRKVVSGGEFGYVEEDSSFKDSDKIFVVKRRFLDQSENELSALIRCQSCFVVMLYATMVNRNERLMFLKHYKFADLRRWLEIDKYRTYFLEDVAVWIISHVYAAVDFLHQRAIYHLDIRPENILLDDNGYPLLAGFSAARRKGDLRLPEKKATRTSGYNYASPEIIDGRKPDSMADMWSTACCFYEIVKGIPAFNGCSPWETKLNISFGIGLDVTGLSSAAYSYISRELHLSRTQRLGYYQGVIAVTAHRLFKDVDWENIRSGDRGNESPLYFLLAELSPLSEGTKGLFDDLNGEGLVCVDVGSCTLSSTDTSSHLWSWPETDYSMDDLFAGDYFTSSSSSSIDIDTLLTTALSPAKPRRKLRKRETLEQTKYSADFDEEGYLADADDSDV